MRVAVQESMNPTLVHEPRMNLRRQPTRARCHAFALWLALAVAAPVAQAHGPDDFDAPAARVPARTLTIERIEFAGLSRTPMELDTYRELLGPETELIGSNDHLLAELPLLLELARTKRLDLTDVVVRSVPLEAAAVNGVLDELEAYTAPLRTVIAP